jgi:hypothetical protein
MISLDFKDEVFPHVTHSWSDMVGITSGKERTRSWNSATIHFRRKHHVGNFSLNFFEKLKRVRLELSLGSSILYT